MIEISDEEFKLLTNYIRSNCGICLGPEKKTLITSRLGGRLEDLGIRSYSDYYQRILEDKDKDTLYDFINRITTNHTFFMREAVHFEFLYKIVLPWIEKSINDKELRVWSAGCSTGEEAYTIAVMISEYFGINKRGWKTDILATDISSRVLKVASRGIYTSDKLERVPEVYRRRYFKQLSDLEYRVKDELRKELVLRRFNLLEKRYPVKKKFQVIFCRNVMIYFDEDVRNMVLDRFSECLEKGGYLFLGQTESLGRDDSRFKYVQPAVYRKG